jgi:tryptophan synthase beta chain
MKLLAPRCGSLKAAARRKDVPERSHARDWAAVDNTFPHHWHWLGHTHTHDGARLQSVIGNECLVQMPEMLAKAGCANPQPVAYGVCRRWQQCDGHLYPYISHANTG